MKDGRPLEFRLKSAGPRKELAKDKAMKAVSSRIGATGSLKPVAKSDPVLLMPSEPPKRFDASGLAGALESADNAGVGEFVRRFVAITRAGGFFVSGYPGGVDARAGGSVTGSLSMEWQANRTVKFAHIFPHPVRDTAKELLGNPWAGPKKLRDPKQIEDMIDSIELFVSACCHPAES